MKIGICLSYKDLASIRKAAEFGYDYIESTMSALATASAEDIAAFIETLKAVNLTCPAVNGFFPGTIRLTGPDADFAAADEYMYKA
nr:hypothetical protein [Clostridia bacterium]